jgi:TonB family protein
MRTETDRAGARHLVVQASFRGVVIDERMLEPRSTARRGARYRIGATARAGAPAPDRLGLSHLVLVEATHDGFQVRATPAMNGTVALDERSWSLPIWVEQRGWTFTLPPGARAHIQCGEMEYRIDWSEPPPPVRGPLLRLRWEEQRYTLGAGVFLLLLMLLGSLIPPDARALSLSRLGRDVRFLPFRLVPPEEQARLGAAAGRTPGLTPPATVPRSPRRRAGKPPARAGGRATTALARGDEIRSSGILGLLRPQGNTALAWLFERGTAIGHDEHEILRDLDGFQIADAHGVGALRIHGTGAQRGQGTIGQGRLHTIGDGPGWPGGSLAGGAASRLAPRRTHAPEIVVSDRPTVQGALDREIIRRIVRRHVNEVRYCYEQELPRAPTLAGRLAVRFTIAPGGQVAAAVVDSSSIDSARLQSCTLQAVRRWTFPEPQGGGIVIATYPFTFVPAGQTP